MPNPERKQGSRSKTDKRIASRPAEAPMMLDQDEILRSMMAVKMDGKRSRKSGDTDESESGEEEEDHDGSDEDREEEGSESGGASGGLDNEEENIYPDSDSQAESSASGAARYAHKPAAKRGRTPSPAKIGVKQEEKSILIPNSQQPKSNLTTSRIKPTQPKSEPSSPSPFNTTKPPPNITFESLNLSPPLISALSTINIRKPTEIQAACVGPIMSGRDCIGGAKTGSGKTMAFALPIVERIARDPFGIWAVVLTPTRELAFQLTEQFLVVGRPLGLTTITVVGGLDMMAQAQALEKRPHIVVATPGRLCDLLRSDGSGGEGKLSRVRTLVLDEADRLLTPTFAPELAYLFSQIPPKRQTCLFTATVSEAIMELANKPPAPGKQKPFVYRVESDTLTVAGLKQKYLFIPSQIRDPYLYHLLLNPPAEIDTALRAKPSKPDPENNKSRKPKKPKHRKAISEDEEDASPSIPSTIIFTQRCATAHLLHLLLNSLDIPSVPLHSHLTQPQRLQSLAQFRAHEVPVLVTTDVGSRGLDIPEVAMVINWDCPRRSDDYVHRVGRTARAGKGGVAVTVVTERDVELVQKIENEVGVRLVELELPEEIVLGKLNAVSVARRMASMEMHDSGFGERQATNKAKAIKRMKRDAAR